MNAQKKKRRRRNYARWYAYKEERLLIALSLIQQVRQKREGGKNKLHIVSLHVLLPSHPYGGLAVFERMNMLGAEMLLCFGSRQEREKVSNKFCGGLDMINYEED